MHLSVCLITKNEADNLERAIRSVKPAADQIILTDTGSSDGTIELAKKLGAEVSHFPWCDDFAAARNFCFSQARCDWIFWIDADEELLTESVDELRQSLLREDVFAYLILRQDLFDLYQSDLYTEMWLPRLFRNHKDVRLVGRIHEQFYPSLAVLAARKGQVVETSKIRIRHYGYVEPQKLEKLKRGLKLIELELQERPEQLYYQIELYRTLLLLEDNRWRSVLNEATENLRQYVNDEKPPMPHAALLLETLLQLPQGELSKELSKHKIRELAQHWFPCAAPLMWVIAKQDFEQGRFEQAEAYLRKLVQMGKEQSYDHAVGFDPYILGGQAQLNLAVCLIRQAKLKEAAEILESLKNNKSLRPAAEHNLNAIKKIRLGHLNRSRRKHRH